MAGIYAVGHISGGHFNPAVTVGLAIAGRTEWRHVPGYVVAQIVGGAVASSALALIAAERPGGLLLRRRTTKRLRLERFRHRVARGLRARARRSSPR